MYSFGSKYYNQTRPLPIILYIQNISLVVPSPSTQQSNMKDFRIGCQLLKCEKIQRDCTAVILVSLLVIGSYFTNNATGDGKTNVYIYIYIYIHIHILYICIYMYVYIYICIYIIYVYNIKYN
jgi:hypothetical protein